MRKLSAHFTVGEMERNSHGFANVMPEEVVAIYTDFCGRILEPIRELLGTPLTITSGYRCPALNSKVGGVADATVISYHVATPAHCAADFIPQGMLVRNAFDAIRLRSYLPIDKVIHEIKGETEWLHVQYRRGLPPRRTASVCDNGVWLGAEYRVMAPPVANKELWGEA